MLRPYDIDRVARLMSLIHAISTNIGQAFGSEVFAIYPLP